MSRSSQNRRSRVAEKPHSSATTVPEGKSRCTNRRTPDRRDFLKTSAAAFAAGSMPYWFTSESARAFPFKGPNDRPVLGCIGTGSRWNAVGPQAMRFSDCVAVCDVDAHHAGKARDKVKGIQSKKGQAGAPEVYGDYRKVLDRDDVDIVTIVTPDHWHTKIAIEAMRAGKDIYCEKPLTLTIEEGKQIRKVLKETGRVFQVGTQQRSEMGLRFLTAVALLRDGRIGEVKRVTCAIGGGPKGGPFKKEKPPEHLDWEMWLGQTPLVEYIEKRCHYQFRWWYEYSGGKMTDWGAHHVDIAQWGIDQNGPDQGPLSVEPVEVEHPVPFKDGDPTIDDQYNTATKFLVRVMFPGDIEMHIRDNAPDLGFNNGILFEGTEGRFLVNRGKIVGKPVEELKTKPLPDGLLEKVYKGKKPGSHMGNFFQCVVSREQPISDVPSHHRALTTCHLANIANRLGRKLQWDPKTEQVVGDKDANAWQSREQRKGYEIDV